MNKALWTLKGKSILVVDDFPDIRALVREMLKNFGATTIDVARNAEQCLELLADKRTLEDAGLLPSDMIDLYIDASVEADDDELSVAGSVAERGEPHGAGSRRSTSKSQGFSGRSSESAQRRGGLPNEDARLSAGRDGATCVGDGT